jgi:hypothetical protein
MSDTNGMTIQTRDGTYKDTDKIKICFPGETARWPVYFVDEIGEYMSDRYIVYDSVKHAKKQAEFLSSKLINFMIFVCHYQIQARVPIELFESIPDITWLDTDTTDDESIYRDLKILEKEVRIIQTHSDIFKRKELLHLSSTKKSRKSQTKATSASKKGGSRKYGRTRKARRFW